MWDRHSVVSVEMFYELDRSGFEIRWGQEVFTSAPPSIQLLLSTRFPVQWVPGPIPGGKAIGTWR
jgi:hypothetical protein